MTFLTFPYPFPNFRFPASVATTLTLRLSFTLAVTLCLRRSAHYFPPRNHAHLLAPTAGAAPARSYSTVPTRPTRTTVFLLRSNAQHVKPVAPPPSHTSTSVLRPSCLFKNGRALMWSDENQNPRAEDWWETKIIAVPKSNGTTSGPWHVFYKTRFSCIFEDRCILLLSFSCVIFSGSRAFFSN